MTVWLEIAYEATDGAVPSSVSIEWAEDTQAPDAAGLVRIVEGVAQIVDRRRVSYVTIDDSPPQPAPPTHFRAYVPIQMGVVCCLRAGSETDVVPIGLGNSPTQEFTAVAVNNFDEGQPMVYGPAPNDLERYVWKKADR
jgi:hypothetical protein